MNSLFLAIGKSTVLHIALGVLLVASMHFSPSNKPKPVDFSAPVINAVSVDKAALDKQIKKIQSNKNNQKKKEEKRIKDLEKRASEAKKKRRREEKKLSDLKKKKSQANKATEAAKRKQIKEQEKASKLEQQRKKKEVEKKQADDAAKKAKAKRQKEEKALDEQKRKRQEAVNKAEQERLLEEQLKAEQSARNKRKNKQVLGEVQKYRVLIEQSITRNLITDDTYKGKKCRINIKLATNGLVIKAKILGGDPILCRATETAVYKTETLPVSSDPYVFEKLRDINLTVEL